MNPYLASALGNVGAGYAQATNEGQWKLADLMEKRKQQAAENAYRQQTFGLQEKQFGLQQTQETNEQTWRQWQMTEADRKRKAQEGDAVQQWVSKWDATFKDPEHLARGKEWYESFADQYRADRARKMRQYPEYDWTTVPENPPPYMMPPRTAEEQIGIYTKGAEAASKGVREAALAPYVQPTGQAPMPQGPAVMPQAPTQWPGATAPPETGFNPLQGLMEQMQEGQAPPPVGPAQPVEAMAEPKESTWFGPSSVERRAALSAYSRAVADLPKMRQQFTEPTALAGQLRVLAEAAGLNIPWETLLSMASGREYTWKQGKDVSLASQKLNLAKAEADSRKALGWYKAHTARRGRRGGGGSKPPPFGQLEGLKLRLQGYVANIDQALASGKMSDGITDIPPEQLTTLRAYRQKYENDYNRLDTVQNEAYSQYETEPAQIPGINVTVNAPGAGAPVRTGLPPAPVAKLSPGAQKYLVPKLKQWKSRRGSYPKDIKETIAFLKVFGLGYDPTATLNVARKLK